jgi:hypothetical protein
VTIVQRDGANILRRSMTATTSILREFPDGGFLLIDDAELHAARWERALTIPTFSQ